MDYRAPSSSHERRQHPMQDDPIVEAIKAAQLQIGAGRLAAAIALIAMAYIGG
jgi:hypothetical protein